MKALKKFWLWFVAMMPFSAWGVTPIVGGLIAGGIGIVGISIWRSFSPVDMKSALDFFSSCWTCQIFSDVMISMSNLLPKVYNAIGHVVIPMSATLLAIFIAWNFLYGAMNNKMDNGSKILGNFGTHVFRLGILIILLTLPLPRIITNVFIEPALILGTSFDYVVSDDNNFSECMVATAIADPATISADASNYGAFSPKLRHQLVCEISNVHQITGLGMSIGWTLMNMAFNDDYMYKVLANIPVFPNVVIFFAGLLILVLYFYALLPIPLYFLEIFVKLSMDLVMLPLMLMAWMFDDENFALFPKGGRTIRQMIDDVIKAVVGIALTVVFLTFSILFLDAAFGEWNGASALKQAIDNNNSKLLMDGLVFNNDSIITVVLMGIFIAMFMTMIPQLTNMLFKIQISDKYYQTAKKDINILWNGFNRIVLGKKSKPLLDEKSSSSSGSSGGTSGGDGSSSSKNYTRVEYIESTGGQYIDTGFKPDSNTSIVFKIKTTGSINAFLFGVKDASNSFSFELFHGRNPSSVYTEYGSFSNSADAGHSIANETLSIDMRRSHTTVYDESGGTLVSIPHPASTFGCVYNLYLLALNDMGVDKSRASCKIYSCLIFDNGALVRDLVPVLDSSGVACLYDVTNHDFYYNAGTVPFIAGPTI